MMAQQVVQEIPGIYGSVRVEEIILQCIWAEQDFLQILYARISSMYYRGIFCIIL